MINKIVLIVFLKSNLPEDKVCTSTVSRLNPSNKYISVDPLVSKAKSPRPSAPKILDVITEIIIPKKKARI